MTTSPPDDLSGRAAAPGDLLDEVPPANGAAASGPPASAQPGAEPPAPAGRPSRAERLEEEGDVAADYLEELLDIIDLDGDIDIDVEDGRASLSIIGDADAEGTGTSTGATAPLRRLTGRHGEVLEALQELTRLAVQARTGERSRLMLDVAGYRAERRQHLGVVAARAIEEVRQHGQPVRLAPMTPFERKVVHDAVAEAGLVSDSEGVEPQRHVVVHPA